MRYRTGFTRDFYIKPSRGRQIDWSHPLSRGLVKCYLLQEAAGGVIQSLVNPDVVANEQVRVLGGTVYDTVKAGNGLRSTAATTGARSVTMDVKLRLQSLSMVWFGQFIARNAGATADVFSCIYDSTTGASPFVGYGLSYASNGLQMRWYWNNTAAFQSITSNQNMPLGTPTMLVGTIDVTSFGGASRLYIQGSLDVSTNNNIATIAYSANSNINFMQGPSWSTGDPEAIGVYGLIYNRELSAGEVNQLYGDPYCFLNPPSTRRYFFYGVAAAATGPTDTDSFIWSG